MNLEIFNSSPDLNEILTTFLAAIIAYVPRVIAAILVFILMKLLAKSVGNIVAKALEAIHLKKVISSFELGFTISDDNEKSFVRVVSLITRYAILYIGLIFIFQILLMVNIANFLIGLLSILPAVISALIIIVVGIILAGLIEGVVKKALVTFDPATARLGGKIASYTVVSFFGLMALAELGIAETIINTLFIGMVASFSLAFALSIGLGSKDLVKTVLDRWYTTRKPLIRKK